MSIVSNNNYNLNLDETHGIAINNNILGIGTKYFIAHNINVITNSANTIYNTTLTNHTDFDNDNLIYVHINTNVSGISTIATLPTSTLDLKSYLTTQKNYKFKLHNNKINTTTNKSVHIYLKNKTQIGPDLYGAYLYYEIMLESLLLCNNENIIIYKLDISKYTHTITYTDSMTKLKCIVSGINNYTFVFNSLSTGLNEDPISDNFSKTYNIDKTTITLTIKHNIKNIINKYTIQLV